MPHRPALKPVLWAGLILAAFSAAIQAAPLGTAFTYQGRIQQGGTLVTGVLDFRFTLFDAPGGAGQIGGPVLTNDTVCTNGLFTAVLDFGPGAFGPDARWLQIEVSPDFPTVSHTLLAPRQEITPAPTALWAADAADAGTLDSIDSSGFALAGHAHAASALTGMTQNSVAFGNATGGVTDDGADFTFLPASNDLNLTSGTFMINGLTVLRSRDAYANIFVGANAGNASATGDANAALGQDALASLTTGYENVAVGAGALSANTSGYENVALGEGAMSSNVTGFRNIAIGYDALGDGTLGHANVAIGYDALLKTDNIYNTAIGYYALRNSTGASRNTAVGARSLENTTAEENTAVGSNALRYTVGGMHNTAVGASAAAANVSGTGNTAVGSAAFTNSQTGNDNTALGINALASADGAGQNTALGAHAMFSNTTGFDNTAVGAYALDGNTTGNANTAVGVNSMGKTTTGTDNTGLGAATLRENVDGDRNTAIGSAALNKNTSANDNTGIGALALMNNTEGSQNTAIGASALLNNAGTAPNASGNTAIGSYALEDNTTGMNNTAIGSSALPNVTASNGNTAIGASALIAATAGPNTAIGSGAGNAITTQTGNIIVGVGSNNGFATNGNDNIVIGHPGDAGVSGRIRIGNNSNHSSTRIAAIFGHAVGAGGIAVVVDANGELGTTVSSAKFKTEIRNMDADAEKLLALRPVTYRYNEKVTGGGPDSPVQYGLIAEEVAQINPDWVVRDEKGEILTVRYEQINAALLGLVQRQHSEMETLRRQMAEMNERLARLEAAAK